MAECIPVILSFCLGSYLRFNTKERVALASVGIALIASSAFVLSGEFNTGWIYFLLDLLQASVGFVAGRAAFRVAQHLRNSTAN